MKKWSVIAAVLLILSALTALPSAAQDAYSDPLCPGSLPSRLNSGDRGQIVEIYSTLRYTPNGATIEVVNAPAQFTVLSKLCDGYTWSLQIQYDGGFTGWATESQTVSEFGYNRYWLAPLGVTLPPPPPPPPPTDGTCPGSLPPQLEVGSIGYIAQVFSTLRDSPGGIPTQIVYAPATFQVIEGPVCDGYLTYYRIVYIDGSTGWANESQLYSPWGDYQYWLLATP